MHSSIGCCFSGKTVMSTTVIMFYSTVIQVLPRFLSMVGYHHPLDVIQVFITHSNVRITTITIVYSGYFPFIEIMVLPQ